jgi:Transglutaminase-like superfamily
MLATNAVATADSTFGGPEDGSVLLTLDGTLMKLNAAGTLIWDILSSNKKANQLTEAELRTLLTNRLYKLLNSPIPRETIHQDLQQFLSILLRRRLLLVKTYYNEAPVYCTAKGVVWSGQKHHTQTAVPRTTNQPPTDQRTSCGRLLTLRALFWLFAYAFFLRTGGFQRIRRIVQLAPFGSRTPCDGKFESEMCRQVCTAVDRAQVFLFWQAMCLQRSIVITRLLVMQGVNAETVIAAHLMPFKSHAWVEVNGEVVSDSPNVQRYYDVVIERLGTRQHIYSGDEG